MRLGVSPAATSTPMGAFNQRFEALFPPRWSPGLCGLLRSPALPPGLSMRECGAVESASYSTACPVHSTICHFSGSASHCIAMRPLHPGCPSLPLLQVWMNVSSYVLGCWTSMPFDFLSVPVWFLFLNCCCPSSGCARRCSVSTYASILARSSLFLNSNILLPLHPTFLSHSSCLSQHLTERSDTF